MRNSPIEGLSGSGKTTVAEELARRGYRVIHGRRGLAFTGDPETGAPLVCRYGLDPKDELEWLHKRWIWAKERVKSLSADHRVPITFFCGGSRKHDRFLGAFVLEADNSTLIKRLLRRPKERFRSRPLVRCLIAHLHKTREELPKEPVAIDATAPLDKGVNDILSRCAIDILRRDAVRGSTVCARDSRLGTWDHATRRSS